jgi:hypothetical protein
MSLFRCWDARAAADLFAGSNKVEAFSHLRHGKVSASVSASPSLLSSTNPDLAITEHKHIAGTAQQGQEKLMIHAPTEGEKKKKCNGRNGRVVKQVFGFEKQVFKFFSGFLPHFLVSFERPGFRKLASNIKAAFCMHRTRSFFFFSICPGTDI